MRVKNAWIKNVWTKNNWLKKRLPLLLVIMAVSLSAKPIYIVAKAYLAQHLLNKAWQETLAGNNSKANTQKPWAWADTYPVGRLAFMDEQGNFNNEWIVLAGFSARTMAFGPAWLQDSAMPNQSGNTVLSAHNDSHFKQLQNLEIGDKLMLESKDAQQLTYQVTEITIVEQNDNRAYEYIDGKTLTLITCYPFTISRLPKTKRLIVQAKAIPTTSHPLLTSSMKYSHQRPSYQY